MEMGVGELQQQHAAHKARLKRMVPVRKWSGIDPSPYWSQMWMWDLIDYREKPPLPPRIREIIEATASYYAVSVNELLSDRRTHYVTIPRHVGMYIAKLLTRRSLPEIGLQFNRDHTVVLYAVRKIEVQVLTQPHIAAAVSVIKRRLGFNG